MTNPADIPGDIAHNNIYEFPPVYLPTGTWTISVTLHRVRSCDYIPSKLSPAINIMPQWRANALMPPRIVAMICARMDRNGTIQEYQPTFVTSGKNIGRANETNVFYQALRDAAGQYARHLRSATSAQVRPMLARTYNIHDDKPPLQTLTQGRAFYVQRKYNGLRAMARTYRPKDDANESGAIIYGRNGIEFSLPNIARAVTRALAGVNLSSRESHDGLYLDGEIYAHGLPLQDISGRVRRGNDEGLKFIIFDVFKPNDDAPYSARLKMMQSLVPSDAIHIAETYVCSSLPEVRAHYDAFLREGYEGAMIRVDAPYESAGPTNYHSAHLWKIKPLYDDEFTIVDYTRATKGQARGALLFICETARGDRFTVSLAGTFDERRKMAERMPREFARKWLHRQLIVKYEELSSSGIPLRARSDGVIREFA